MTEPGGAQLADGEWATQYAWHRDGNGNICWCETHGEPYPDTPALAFRRVWFGPAQPIAAGEAS
jgi:hypothetical protein